MREALITRRRINGEKVEDIEQQLEEAGYVSAEEAEEEDIRAAVAAAAESHRGARGASGPEAQSTQGRSLSAAVMSWFTPRPRATSASSHAGQQSSQAGLS